MALLKANTGIGTTNPQVALHVFGNSIFTGIITASSFTGNITGTATTATNLSDAANITTGTISSSRLSGSYGIDITGTATTATNLSDAANITTGTISSSRLLGTYGIDITGTATTATTALGFSTTASINTSGIITAFSFVKSSGTSSQFLKADGSVDSNTYLTTTGSGTALTGIVTSIVAGTGITISGSTGQVTINASESGGSSSQWTTYPAGISTTSNVGIGTTNPIYSLDVAAIQIRQDAGSNNRIVLRGTPGSVSRWSIDNFQSGNTFRIFREDDITAANGSVAVSISTTGTLTATKFSGDGSLLTGVTASGSGVVIQNQDSNVGTASTINFSTNLTASFSSGTATISLSNNPSISGILTADQVYTSNNGNGQNVRIGDDFWIGDVNVSNTARFSGAQDSTNAFIIFGSSDAVALGRTGTGPLYYGGNFTSAGIITATRFSGDGSTLTGIGVTQWTTYPTGISTTSNVGIGTTRPTVKLDVVGDAKFTGIITASSFTGNLSGTATTANNLSDAANITTGTISSSRLSGSYGISITGTATTATNLSDAANITTGTINKDRISNTNSLTVLGDLYVSNNISFGGSTTQLNTQQLNIVDADIVLGIGTSFSPTDNTANHGGIAIASTEGTPLVNLNIVPEETNPSTYKKIMWFKGDAIGAGLTDAWLFNYGVGIGSTQVPYGVRLAVGGIQMTDSSITATTFTGNLSGTATTANNLSNAANITTGTISSSRLSGSYGIDITGTATTATNLSDAANITTGTISSSRLSGSYGIDIIGTATTANNVSSTININTSGIITATQLDLSANASTDDSVLYLSGAPLGTSTRNGLLGIGQLSFSDTDIIANFTHNVNGYAQVVVQNKNSGANSSADIIVNNDRSAGTTYYGDFGINGTTFSGGGVFGDVDGTYLYAAGGTLSLGSLNAYDVKIAANNTERVRVSAAGSVGIGTTNPSQTLHVQGNARITGAIYDSTNSTGTSGQVLQSTVTGTQWTTASGGGGGTNLGLVVASTYNMFMP